MHGVIALDRKQRGENTSVREAYMLHTLWLLLHPSSPASLPPHLEHHGLRRLVPLYGSNTTRLRQFKKANSVRERGEPS